MTNKTVKIEFVSDVACPWCAVGLGSLEKAIENVKDRVEVSLSFRPFELNPSMPKGGEDTVEHLTKKYGISAEQIKANQAQIRDRANEVGFQFNDSMRGRIYNTFNCHRLLHWALEVYGSEKQYALKRALLSANFYDHANLDDNEVLLRYVEKADLDVNGARQLLASDQYTQEVRQEESHYTSLGIRAVPSIIFNGRHLVQGGQPVEVFEQALLQLAGE